MAGTIKSNKTVEMTISLRRLAKRASWRYKALKGVKYLKKFIQKQFKSEDDVLIAPDVNKYVWSRGMRSVPGRMRIRVERSPSNKNPAESVFRLSLVEVSTFKGLNSQVIQD